MIRPANRPRGNSSSAVTTLNNGQIDSNSSSGRPTHIALPSPQPQPQSPSLSLGFSRSRSRPTTPSSPSAPGHTSADYGFGPASPSLGSAGSPRQGFLSTLMNKTRPRGSTLSRNAASGSMVPTMGSVVGFSGGGEGSASGEGGSGVERSGTGLGIGMGGVGGGGGGGGAIGDASASGSGGAAGPSNPDPSTLPTPQTHRIRLVPHLESYRSLHFEPVVRDLTVCPPGRDASIGSLGTVLKIGRFTDKTPPPAAATAPTAQQTTTSGMTSREGSEALGGADTTGGETNGSGPSATSAPVAQPSERAGAGGGGNLTSSKVAFKSKVVSRGHAEIWSEGEGKFFLKDTKSSSGTFLNHIRLSNPNQESRPFPIKDGDVIQLGVDYQGGTEEMYRCVKMKVEVGRERQRGQQNNFNKEAMKQLKALGGVPESPGPSTSTPSKSKPTASVTDCCICLFSVTVQQALFIAPCSHVFHYKCIRPLLQIHHPGFSCPLCRAFHDLEADVETEDAWEVASRRQSVLSRRNSSAAIAQLAPAAAEQDIPPVPPIPSRQLTDDAPAEDADDMDVDVDVSENSLPHTDPAIQGTPIAERADPLGEIVHPTSPTSPGSASRPIFSLGSLPVPGVGGHGSHNNSEYALLDAATPMNTTFLSTLAEGTGGMFGGPSGIDGSLDGGPAVGGRTSLELVAEGDEENSIRSSREEMEDDDGHDRAASMAL